MNDSDNNRNEYEHINTLENYQNENKNENKNEIDFAKIDNKISSSLFVYRKVQNKESTIPMTVLFDSGGSSTMIHERCLPPGVVPYHYYQMKNRDFKQWQVYLTPIVKCISKLLYDLGQRFFTQNRIDAQF